MKFSEEDSEDFVSLAIIVLACAIVVGSLCLFTRFFFPPPAVHSYDRPADPREGDSGEPAGGWEVYHKERIQE